ncbi:DsbA family oxidoreductase [Paenibacillus sp. y28]|uniref:DsbA family oxidoreductase n=1 Tax=Paenibacillus sp. y28 TaxID=3129110 RepID=UPI00301B2103
MLIEIYSDTVCPWCRIGKKNLADALSRWSGEEVELRPRAFLLDGTTPEQGLPFREYMSRKIGRSEQELDQVFDQVTRAGAQSGLTFDFSKVKVYPNTRLSHRLILGVPENKQMELFDRVMQAYFEEGRDIGDVEILLDIAEEAGLDREAVRKTLSDTALNARIDADLSTARQLGIRGVPFFVMDGRYALSGAQPAEAFLQALEQAAQKE